MWSKISSALKPREGNDFDAEHSDALLSPNHPPDPFCINATTYYTPQVPPSPPQSRHSVSTSREEDIIWSLRTQLALQQELCAQFEIDLRARDELVGALTIRLAIVEKENDKRKSVVRSWKKKAADLEKMCRHLEEKVDLSRQETMERSIMDEASDAALRQLHKQIAQLEREKIDVEADRDSLKHMAENAVAEIAKLKEGHREANEEHAHRLHDRIAQLERENKDMLRERDAAARTTEKTYTELRAHIQQLRKDSAAKEVTIVQLNRQLNQVKEDIDGLNIALDSKQQELELVKRKHSARAAVGPAPSRSCTTPSSFGKLAGNTSQTTKNSQRISITSTPSKSDKKENTTCVPLKHPRRTMVTA